MKRSLLALLLNKHTLFSPGQQSKSYLKKTNLFNKSKSKIGVNKRRCRFHTLPEDVVNPFLNIGLRNLYKNSLVLQEKKEVAE